MESEDDLGPITLVVEEKFHQNRALKTLKSVFEAQFCIKFIKNQVPDVQSPPSGGARFSSSLPPVDEASPLDDGGGSPYESFILQTLQVNS